MSDLLYRLFQKEEALRLDPYRDAEAQALFNGQAGGFL